MALYATREGPLATANAWGNLTTFGGATLNQVQVPKGYQSVKEIWMTHHINGGATDTTGCVVLGRLKGDAIVNGPQDFVVGAWGNEQTGNSGIAKGYMVRKIPVDIKLKDNSNFWLQGMQFTNSDCGTPEVSLTAVLTKAGSEGKLYRIRNVSNGSAVDTEYQLTNDAETTSVGAMSVPPGMNAITGITAAFGGLTIATASGGTTLGRIKGDVEEGEQVFGVSGIANLSTTTGVTDIFAPATYIPTCLKVKDGGHLRLYMEQTGVAVPTTFQLAMGLEFSKNAANPMTYIHREGPLNGTGDIDAVLSTQGSVTTPGTIIVPSNKKKIAQIGFCFGDGTPSGADSNANIVARLAGSGLVDGEQLFTVGTAFNVFTTAGDNGFGQMAAVYHDVDIDVIPGGAITASAQQALGVDLGAPEAGITLGFV